VKQIAAQLAERHDLSQKQSEAILAPGGPVGLAARYLKKDAPGCA
jgi:hypothetical protein